MITNYLLHQHANVQIFISIDVIQPFNAILVSLQIVPSVELFHIVVFIFGPELQTNPPSFLVKTESQN